MQISNSPAFTDVNALGFNSLILVVIVAVLGTEIEHSTEILTNI